jgi:hypothetical protein
MKGLLKPLINLTKERVWGCQDARSLEPGLDYGLRRLGFVAKHLALLSWWLKFSPGLLYFLRFRALSAAQSTDNMGIAEKSKFMNDLA